MEAAVECGRLWSAGLRQLGMRAVTGGAEPDVALVAAGTGSRVFFVEDRLVPVNATLALVARDGGWFEDLAEQGLGSTRSNSTSSRLPVWSAPMSSFIGPSQTSFFSWRVRADPALRSAQARGYDAAEVDGIRARADLPNELVGRLGVAVSPLYVCLDERRNDVVESLAVLGLEAPVLSVGPGYAMLDGPVPAGLERFSRTDVLLGLPPPRIRLDRESPLEEFMSVLLQRVVAAAVQGHSPPGLRRCGA